MTEDPIAKATGTGISALLSGVRALPVWMLGGLAVAGYVILFVPSFGHIDASAFRAHWGIWLWVEALTFSILALARAADTGVSAYLMRRREIRSRRVLNLVPLYHQCWWHLAKQQDNSFASQIRIDIEAANLTNRPVRIVKARLVRPRARGQLLHADVSLPMEGSPYHSNKHAVPPHGTATAAVHIMVRGALAAQGRPIRATVGLTDQFGNEYLAKRVELTPTQPILPRVPWKARFVGRLKALSEVRPGAKGEVERTAPERQQHEKIEEVDLVLNEEMRLYAVKGRRVGGLGSMNVGLQSEPTAISNEGAPSILWDSTLATPVASPNAVRLIKFRDGLDEHRRHSVETYLLDHLDRKSPYAEVAYLTFFCLHRMGRTVDALRAARACLAGDKVYGYSNVLGLLSAIISREHSSIPRTIYHGILESLSGDTEYDFRLRQKINLACLQKLDSELLEKRDSDSG